MAIPMFLAMTMEEMQSISPLPSIFAFLGCHFSAETSKLEGLPHSLPSGCGLILDDRTPIPDVKPEQILHLLSPLDAAFVLLDFQQPPTKNSMKLAAALTELTCPVPMPPVYAKDLDCPVFLPPVPPNVPLEDHLKHWHNREIWLELALDGVQITVTTKGSRITYAPHAEPQDNAHRDSMLHCHYKITQKPEAIEFYCYRTREDIISLLRSPLPPGISHTIGLFQELDP